MDSVSLDAWKSRGQFVKLLGHELFFIDEPARGRERGTLFLIHGFPTASWDWWKVWPALNENYRLVALDLFGFGFSAKPLPPRLPHHGAGESLRGTGRTPRPAAVPCSGSRLR
ncbi:MAG: pimeloyl-ACP methyl ester carboxylesterase [Halieaceae bacterium]|jgi:pimeloyl-ACP methyl ester carboxylesterase